MVLEIEKGLNVALHCRFFSVLISESVLQDHVSHGECCQRNNNNNNN